MNDLETRINELLAKQEELKTMLNELEAVNAIQFLMGRFVVLWSSPKTRKNCLALYADREDSSHESYAGYFVGRRALKEYLDPEGGFEAATGLPEKGTFFEHHLATPTIRVAKDGKTARGLWQSPGAESFGGKGANGRPLPLWCYGKYLCDFIFEDGVWKIWHTHFYVTFMTPYNISWVDVPDEIRRGGDGAPGARANSYNPDGVYHYIPEAPEAYDTWTDDRMRP